MHSKNLTQMKLEATQARAARWAAMLAATAAQQTYMAVVAAAHYAGRVLEESTIHRSNSSSSRPPCTCHCFCHTCLCPCPCQSPCPCRNLCPWNRLFPCLLARHTFRLLWMRTLDSYDLCRRRYCKEEPQDFAPRRAERHTDPACGLCPGIPNIASALCLSLCPC